MPNLYKFKKRYSLNDYEPVYVQHIMKLLLIRPLCTDMEDMNGEELKVRVLVAELLY